MQRHNSLLIIVLVFYSGKNCQWLESSWVSVCHFCFYACISNSSDQTYFALWLGLGQSFFDSFGLNCKEILSVLCSEYNFTCCTNTNLECFPTLPATTFCVWSHGSSLHRRKNVIITQRNIPFFSKIPIAVGLQHFGKESWSRTHCVWRWGSCKWVCFTARYQMGSETIGELVSCGNLP